MPTVLKPDQKSNKISKPNLNSNRKANPTPSTSRSSSKDKDKDRSKPRNQNQKRPDLIDKLRKDGKLTTQEHQRHLDNELCLLCSKSGHMVHNCPKSMNARAAKASNPKTSETKAEFLAKAFEAKKWSATLRPPHVPRVALTCYVPTRRLDSMLLLSLIHLL